MRMPAMRELSLAAALLLTAVAVFHGGAAGDGMIPWLALGAQPVIGVQSRLDSPVGLWNQLALLGDFALPLALWLATRRRVLGTLLAFGWIVALALTLSRGGVIVAVVVVALWLWLGDDAWGSAATVVAAALPAVAVAGL